MIMEVNCSACGVSAPSQGNTVVLYSPSPVLLGKVAGILWHDGIQVTRENHFLVLPYLTDAGATLAALAARLEEFERRALKVGGRSPEEMFTAEPLDARLERYGDSWFREALANDKFIFHFQPIVDIAQYGVFGYECLVRLQREKLYSGGQITEASSRSGNMHQFDAYCRVKAIRSAAQQAGPGTKIFVNFAPSTIQHPSRSLQPVMLALDASALTPRDVVFEVVESDHSWSLSHLREIADYYRGRGFGFALDDFGSGSNSLQMMCEFRPDYIKLDKSFTQRMEDPMRLVAVQKVVELADRFGVTVIAEGVESGDTACRLSSAGVRYMQGYYFGRPAPSMLANTRDLLRLMQSLREHSPAEATPLNYRTLPDCAAIIK
jgi:EAL domain-containing protein (putative c-di-GMP-specific phosphodiesterase class I)